MQALWVVGESPSWVQSLAAVPALVKLQRRGHLHSAWLCPLRLPLRLLLKLH